MTDVYFISEDSQICFECKFRRGHIDPNEPARYEPVSVRASFRQSSCLTSKLFELLMMFNDLRCCSNKYK